MRKCKNCNGCTRYLLVDNNYLILVCDFCHIIYRITKEGLVEIPKDDELYQRIEFLVG